MGYSLHSAASRPEMYATLFDANHPMSSSLWPQFVTSTPTSLRYWDKLSPIPYFAQYQLITVEKGSGTRQDAVVACANSIPVFCSVDNLPDGGWDAVLQEGMEMHFSNTDDTQKSPNLLSALGLTVSRDHHRLEFADVLILALRELAKQSQFEALVVPLRPTRKCEHPFVDLGEYLKWKTGNGTGLDSEQIYDPWLRKHVSLGGKPVKIAPHSMSVKASGQQWSQWKMGRSLLELAEEQHACMVKPSTGSEYIDLQLSGALVPVRHFPAEDMASYVERNVWVVHPLH